MEIQNGDSSRNVANSLAGKFNNIQNYLQGYLPEVVDTDDLSDISNVLPGKLIFSSDLINFGYMDENSNIKKINNIRFFASNKSNLTLKGKIGNNKYLKLPVDISEIYDKDIIVIKFADSQTSATNSIFKKQSNDRLYLCNDNKYDVNNVVLAQGAISAGYESYNIRYDCDAVVLVNLHNSYYQYVAYIVEPDQSNDNVMVKLTNINPGVGLYLYLDISSEITYNNTISVATYKIDQKIIF